MSKTIQGTKPQSMKERVGQEVMSKELPDPVDRSFCNTREAAKYLGVPRTFLMEMKNVNFIPYYQRKPHCEILFELGELAKLKKILDQQILKDRE